MTSRRPIRDHHDGRHNGSPRRAGIVVRGLGALALTLGFVAGVPYLLIRIGAFPTSIPEPSTLWRAAIGPDLTGRGVFVVLAALVWIGWAWFTLSVLRETAAAIRTRGRRPARRPGRGSWSVQPAAILVAAIVAMFVTAPLLAAGAPPAAAAGHPGADSPARHGTVAAATHTAANSSAPTRATSSATTPASTSHASTSQRTAAAAETSSAKSSKRAPAVTTTSYTVRRYDTLWTIAEKQLGDPTRYREIVKLNPHLQHDTTIHTGETLKLPQHHAQKSRPATGTARQAGAVPQVDGEQVTVQLGDTVSEISTEHGVPDWHTVWDANKGRAEPGGKRFTDPDHIEVGWTLTVPAASKGAAAPAAPAQAPAATAPAAPATEAPAPAADGHDGAASASTETAAAAPQPQRSPAPARAPGAAVGADHRHSLLEEQDGPAEAGVTSQLPAPALPTPAQAAPAPAVPNHAGAESSSSMAEDRSLSTVAGYVAGGTVLAAGMLAALVLVRRQQWRVRRPGRTVAAIPPQLIPIERAIATAASPSADETERIDQVLRRVAATDITPLHVAAVQLSGGDITLHLREPATLPAPWRLTADPSEHQPTPDGSQSPGEGSSGEAASGVVWTFPAEQHPEAAGADPKIVDAIAPYPTLVHVGTDAASAWLLNLEQLGGLLLTGDRDRCLALARVMSAQMGVNAWAELVTVTMLGFGEELLETAPSRLRYAPLEQAGAVLASATGSAITTADYSDDQVGMPVVEARRTAANDEAWGVHVLVTAPPVTGQPAGPAGPDDSDQQDGQPSAKGQDGYRDQVAELLGVLHDRAGTTAAAAVVIDEHQRGEGFPGATVAHLDASGILTLPGVGLTVQATGWDEETSRGVGTLMAHLRNASDESVPDARGDQPWHQLTDSAGALRTDLVQPRSTPTVHDSSRAAGATTLPLADQAYLDVAATTVEDLQILAPTVPADVLEQVMAADRSLDADVAAWFDQDSGRAKLAVLGPVTLTTTQPPPKRVAYYAELAAYLAFRPQGATAEQIRTSFGLSAGSARAYLSTLREYLGKDPLTGVDYMAGAKDSAAGKARGVGIYQIAGVLLDADLFRRLRSRGQARGPAGLEDYATALRLVTGPPFSQMREEGGAWLLEGDRVDQHLTVAIVDVAHLLATSALAAGDTASARAVVDISRLAAPDEEAPRLDSAAVDRADGRAAHARRTLVEQVCNRSDDGEPPLDLSPRTRQILAHHRDWLSRAS
jgi:nucleoid-associated protein YgaU